jgi:two-component system, NarL family, nitrate/nitrite response regulator NarL
MSNQVRGMHGLPGVPTRILVTGSDLLSGALASALETKGFATMDTAPSVPEIERGIEWKPNLVLFDVRSFDLATGCSFIEHFSRAGLQVCVIDAADNDVRCAAWLRVGPLEVIDGRESFENLFLTITRLLRVSLPPQAGLGPSAVVASVPADGPSPDPRLLLFAALSNREKVVLAELMEGHCAEEIAKAAFLSISTIRSQIKSILQKLGVNSQLAAVALARRVGWSLDHRDTSPKPATARRSRAS